MSVLPSFPSGGDLGLGKRSTFAQSHTRSIFNYLLLSSFTTDIAFVYTCSLSLCIIWYFIFLNHLYNLAIGQSNSVVEYSIV